MDIDKLKIIFNKVSLGEASREEVLLIESIEDEKFFSYIEEFKLGSTQASLYNLGLIFEEEEEVEIDTTYSEVIPEYSNVNKVKVFARRKGLLKRFFRQKQRIRKQDLI